MYPKHIRLALFLFFCNSPYTFHLMGSILSERQFQAEVNIPHYASFKDRRAHLTKTKHFLLNFHFCQKLWAQADICSDCRHIQGYFRTMITIQIWVRVLSLSDDTSLWCHTPLHVSQWQIQRPILQFRNRYKYLFNHRFSHYTPMFIRHQLRQMIFQVKKYYPHQHIFAS